MPVAELEWLWRRLEPLSVDHMPLSEPLPRESRFGSPLNLSKVHRVCPEMVEVSYAEWAPDRILRQVVYLGEHGDKQTGNRCARQPPG
jgi:bifunctional non-homologous end joining protein LigD